MAIKNFTGGHYSRTWIDDESGSKQIQVYGVPGIPGYGAWGSSGDSYRAGIRLDTRGYDYMYFQMTNHKWRFITVETSTVIDTVAAALPARGALVTLRNTTGTTTGSRAPRECRYVAAKQTPAGGTQIVLERTFGRYPDPEFRSDWSFWANYYGTGDTAKLTDPNDSDAVICVLNRNASGNLYSNDVAGNTCLTHATPANNWTLKQCQAFGRANSINAHILFAPYMPYYQLWTHGGDGDEAGIAGADDTHGMTDWQASEAASSYSYDTYAHTNDGSNPQLKNTMSKAGGDELDTYTGTARWSMEGMWNDNWGAAHHHFPLKVFVTSDPGPYGTQGGSWMGFHDYLPNALWLAFSQYNVSPSFTTAASGWTNNGGFTSESVVSNVEALNVSGDGDYDAFNQTGACHLCECDVSISMFKRGFNSK